MSVLKRSWRVPAAATLVAVALSATGVATVGAKSSGRADTGTAYVAVTHQVGKVYVAAGATTDKVLGSGAVVYDISASTGTTSGTLKITSKKVTEFSSTGSLSGTAAGTEVIGSGGAVTVKGTLKLAHGAGGQAGHSFVGTFTGTGKSATGPFVFHLKGIYK